MIYFIFSTFFWQIVFYDLFIYKIDRENTWVKGRQKKDRSIDIMEESNRRHSFTLSVAPIPLWMCPHVSYLTPSVTNLASWEVAVSSCSHFMYPRTKKNRKVTLSLSLHNIGIATQHTIRYKHRYQPDAGRESETEQRRAEKHNIVIPKGKPITATIRDSSLSAWSPLPISVLLPIWIEWEVHFSCGCLSFGGLCVFHLPVVVTESFDSRNGHRLSGTPSVEYPTDFSVFILVSHSSSVSVPLLKVDQWPVVVHRIHSNLQVRPLLVLEVDKCLWSFLLNNPMNRSRFAIVPVFARSNQETRLKIRVHVRDHKEAPEIRGHQG